MLRMLSAQGRVNLARLHRPNRLTDEDWSNLYQAADVLSNAPIYIDDSPALSTVQLRARARRLKAERRLGLVVIDYLQLMRASRRIDSREQEISEISRSLKGLAKELSIPVVALAQLNRKLEDRKDRRPQLADLRESGAIEQDADVIMFIYRDDVYKIARAQDRPDCGEAEIIIGKQRTCPGSYDPAFGNRDVAAGAPHPCYKNVGDRLTNGISPLWRMSAACVLVIIVNNSKETIP